MLRIKSHLLSYPVNLVVATNMSIRLGSRVRPNAYWQKVNITDDTVKKNFPSEQHTLAALFQYVYQHQLYNDNSEKSKQQMADWKNNLELDSLGLAPLEKPTQRNTKQVETNKLTKYTKSTLFRSVNVAPEKLKKSLFLDQPNCMILIPKNLKNALDGKVEKISRQLPGSDEHIALCTKPQQIKTVFKELEDYKYEEYMIPVNFAKITLANSYWMFTAGIFLLLALYCTIVFGFDWLRFNNPQS